jgi:hypothetical protein
MVIPFRSALIGEVKYIDESLVLYRRHSYNTQFKEAKDVKGPQELYLDMLRLSNGKIAIYRNRLQDLETMLQLFPGRRQTILKVRKLTERTLREMKDEKSLLLESNPVKRLGIMGRAIWQGTPPRRLARWLITFFFPKLYLRYLRAKMS